MYRSAEEIHIAAMNLIEQFLETPDPAVNLAELAGRCQHRPAETAQIMMALIAWHDHALNEQQLQARAELTRVEQARRILNSPAMEREIRRPRITVRPRGAVSA